MPMANGPLLFPQVEVKPLASNDERLKKYAVASVDCVLCAMRCALYGCMVVWLCGCVVMWLCDCVIVLLCGCVVVWLCGCVVAWLRGSNGLSTAVMFFVQGVLLCRH